MKRLSVILALAVGVVLGYAARDFPVGTLIGQGNETETTDSEKSPSNAQAGQPAGVVADASPTEQELPEVQPFPASDTVLDYVLPDRALAQLRIDTTEIRDSTSEKDLSALLSQQAMQELFLRISENAEPSFGQLIQALAADARNVHLFLLPPKGEIPVPTLLVTAKWPEVSYEDLHQRLRDPIAGNIEDAETYSEPVGEFTMEGVRAPTGNVSYVVTEEAVWICNNRDALAELFTMESLPEPGGFPPLQSLLKHVPNGPVVAALDLRPEPDGSAGPSGVLAFLAGLGIDRIAAGWGGSPASLTLFGAFNEPPAWSKEWPPLDNSDLRSSLGGSLAVVHASLPPLPGMDFPSPMSAGFGSREGGREPRFRRSPDERREEPRDRWGERRGPRMGGRRSSLRFRAMAATRSLPPAQKISIRLAPGEEDLVVWRVTFRGDSEKLSQWYEQIENAPWCQVEETDTGLRRLTFEESPLSMAWGVEQLLIGEEENSLMFYSSQESSRLLSPSGGSTGAMVMESSSDNPAEPPQIHADISADFLQLLMLGEKASLAPSSPDAAKIANLLDVLAGFTSPITFDLTILADGIRARVQAEHQMAAALGPILIASALFRGGI